MGTPTQANNQTALLSNGKEITVNRTCAGTARKINKQVLWVLAAAFFVALIKFSYDYHSELHINTFTEMMKNAKLLNSTRTFLNEKLSPLVVKKPKPPTGMWTVNAIGRLGNLMGEYATLYSLAKMNGHNAYILPTMNDQLSKIFKITLPMIHQDVSNKIKWRYYGLNDWMSDEYRHIEGEYVHFTGYPCSFTFYHHIRDEILREFTFHDFIREESYAYLDKKAIRCGTVFPVKEVFTCSDHAAICLMQSLKWVLTLFHNKHSTAISAYLGKL
ncbi:galactoside alpha-(1,2)-fucosyltransferase 2-like isoform X2 [Hyperolius riggenbachi]|uniref:galactoside alpha-(1,2)-fucosyltransferase 2-like isoform X2 n=1 Tax=Hyperolius riggenbachi TaxID=752182 RepID=UPI0035A3A450